MVLEATMICIDNSEWTRNGDYPPTRFQAQADAVNLICGAKTQSNPENSRLYARFHVYRGGSAPPTVEGSRKAIGSLFGRSEVRGFDGQKAADELSDEEMRSQLAYMSYYHSNENLNPRLPPHLLSKEDWRVAQRFGFGESALGGIDD